MTDQKAAIAAVTSPTTFDFAAAVSDRSYPTIEVPIYLNERSIQTMLDIYKERSELELRIAGMKSENVPLEFAQRMNDLTELYDLTREELKGEEYVVKITGISPEETEELEQKSYEAFPREFTESVNPVTGGLVKTEVDSPARDKHFATLLRQAHLVSVTAPNGAVDTNFSDLDKVRAAFARMPMLARAKVDEAINASTILVDFYRELVDEVF